MAIEQLQKVKGLQKPKTQSFKVAQLEKLKQRVQARQAQENRTRALKSEAARLDAEIKNNNFLGSVSNYKAQYNAIPEEIRKYMTYNVNSAEGELQNRIKKVQEKINNIRVKEMKSKNSVSKKKFRAERIGFQEGLNRLKAGELLSLNEISNYADRLGDIAKAKQSQREDRALEKTKTVAAQKQIDSLFKKIEQNKALSVQDFRTAKTLGISNKDLLKAASDTAKYNRLQTELKKQTKVPQTNKFTEQQLRENLSKTFGIELATQIKTEKLAELSGLYSSVQKEKQRQQVEQFINASVSRRLSTQNQIISLQNAITKQKNFLIQAARNNIAPAQATELLSTVDKLKAKTGGTQFRLNIDKITTRILQSDTSNTKNAKVALLRLSTLPGALIDSAIEFAAPILDPLLTAAALSQMERDTLRKSAVNLGSGIQKGDSKALADYFLLFAPLKIPAPSKIKTAPIKNALTNYIKNTSKQIELLGNQIKTGTKALSKTKLKQLKDLKKSLEESIKSLKKGILTKKTKQDIKKNPDKLKSKPTQPQLQKGLPKVVIVKPKKVPIPTQIDKLTQYIQDQYKLLSQTDFRKLRNRIKQQRNVIFTLNKKGEIVEMKRKGEILISKKKVNPKAETKKFVSQITSTKDAEIYVREIKQGKTLSKLTKEDINKILNKPKGKELIKDKIKEFEKQRVDLILQNQQLIAAGKTIGKLPNEKAVKKRIGIEVAKNKQLINVLERKILELKKSFKDFKPKEVSQDLFRDRQKIFKDKFKKESLKVSFKVTDKTKSIFIRIGEFEFEFSYSAPAVPLKGSKKGRLQKGGFDIKIRRIKKTPLKNFQKFKDRTQSDFKKAMRKNTILRKADKYYERNEKLKYSTQRKIKQYSWDKDTLKKFKDLRKQIDVQNKALDKIYLKAFELQFLKIFGQLKATDVKTQTQLQFKIKNLQRLENILKGIKTPIEPFRPKKPKKPTKKVPKKKVFKKPVLKKPVKKPVKAKKIKKIKKPVKPPKKPPKIKLPKFTDPLPRGTRLSFNIRIAKKVFPVKLPLNKALKRATTIVLRDKKLKRFDIIIAGTTKQKDILRTKAIEKFKGTRGNKLYTYTLKKKFA